MSTPPEEVDSEYMTGTELSGQGEVAEHEASIGVADAYKRLKETLGVSHVPTIYRLMASQEEPFVDAVDALTPALETLRTEGLAHELRSVISDVREFELSVAVDEFDRLRIEDLISRYRSANPLNLAFVLLLGVQAGSPPTPIMHDRLPDRPTSTDVAATLADILACHGGVTVPGFWREMLRTPPLGERAWRIVREMADVGFVHRAAGSVLERASDVVATLPDYESGALLRPFNEVVRKKLSWFPVGIATMVAEVELLAPSVTVGLSSNSH